MKSDELFAKGKEAADRANFEYAVAMFLNVVTENPEHREARLALRACEEQIFKARGAGFSAKLTAVTKGLGPWLKAMTAKKPEKVMEACERFLTNWPFCSSVTMKLAAALKRMGHIKSAIQTLEYLTRRQPQNAAALQRLADYMEEDEQFAEACKCYEQICRLKPRDDVARRKLKELSATAHVDRTGLDRGATSMDTVRDTEKTKELLRSEQMTKSRDQLEGEVEKLQAEISEDPNDTRKLAQLGQLYLQQEKLKLALQAFEKAYEIDQRPSHKVSIGDIHLRAFRKAERQAEEALKSNPGDEEAKKKLQEIQRRRTAFEVQEFEWRCREYPTDMRLADRLGDAYARRSAQGDLQKAILQYQKASNDPRLRARTSRKLAACFAQSPATYDMALNQFRRARESTDSVEEQKRIDYETGLLCERMGKNEEALDAFKRVYEVDAAFRDTGERILKLTQQQNA